MTKYFTRDQAQRLLPKVEDAIRDALFVKADFQEADQALRSATRAILMSGGMNVNRDRLLAIRSRRDSAATKLQELLESIQEQGCIVKDLDIGLLDFPTLYRGREVYLCWRLGETGIGFWHDVHAGFPGRKPIDEEFLANHTNQTTA
jgi:hypothetical protein